MTNLAKIEKVVDKEKASYVKQRLLQLDDWRTSVDLLKANAERTIARTRKQYNQQIEDLLNKYLQAQTKLNGLQHANEKAWSDRKSSVDQAWQDLNDSLERARSQFK